MNKILDGAREAVTVSKSPCFGFVIESNMEARKPMAEHTPTPWFVSGVRFRMNGGEWQSVNRYDEALKRDENVACVGYDPRTGAGLTDAHFIVKAVNSHDALVQFAEFIRDGYERTDINHVDFRVGAYKAALDVLAVVGEL